RLRTMGWPEISLLLCLQAEINLSCKTDNKSNRHILSDVMSSSLLAFVRDLAITVLLWTRPDLGPDYVFVYRDNQPDPDSQHPSFRERVELKDSQMKDGDVSVTLKDVTFTDTGTYECRVTQSQIKRKKRAPEPDLISTVHLRVSAGECLFKILRRILTHTYTCRDEKGMLRCSHLWNFSRTKVISV
uniref:Ig-like domain-containing protein n=1 Tax=Mastacembelus armatus TaxID=205130 RepID=A0A3Q3M2Q8_9TELE